MARTAKTTAASTGANLGFEAEMFKAADKLRGNMEPSDYNSPLIKAHMPGCHPTASRTAAKAVSSSFEMMRTI